MAHDLRQVARSFQIRGDYVSAKPYGSGHINDTYAVVVSRDGTRARYIFQRINNTIFKNIPGLMSNVARVCEHVQASLARKGCDDASRRALTLIPTRDGAPFYQDFDGGYWRVYVFIKGATGYDIIENENQAYEAARAFGEFQKSLVDLAGGRLHETIPGFHDTRKRYAAFEAALSADAQNRAADAKAEIDWVWAHKDLTGGLLELHEQGLMPERVTHNDTKLNNVLIDDNTQEALCVIDLDTLMPGLALHDFGDLVRTSTSPVAEDEPDASKVTMQMSIFKALTRGYLEATGDFLTHAERANLPLAGMVMTFECGIRFLTDYLQGDTYFKTHRPGHNLDRCRTQFALVDSIDVQQEKMNDCVASV